MLRGSGAPTTAVDSVGGLHCWRYALIFLILFAACAIALDLRLKMWNDEVVTLYVAQQGNPGEIVRATKEGMDATPPFYPILVSTILPMVRPDALAVRLLATLGFTGMLACVLAFCRRRMSAPCAFIAALLLTLTCGFYATEGRCYGLVLGFAAGALLCWQSVREARRKGVSLVLLAACLAMATALHYYSIFLLVPLALGELVRWRRRGKTTLGVVVAMLPALLVLAIHYPLISAGRRYLGHFWAPGLASWRQLPDFYLQYALIPAGVAIVALVVKNWSSESPAERLSSDEGLPADEWTMLLALTLLPVLVLVTSRFTTHVFLARYTLTAAIGIAIASAALLYVCSSRRPVVGATVAVVLLLGLVGVEIFDLHARPALRQGEEVRRQLQAVGQGSEPIVIGYDHAFMELSYYAAPEVRQRLYYVLNQKLELQHVGSDLDYQLMSARAKRTGLHIVELDDFLRTNRRFLLANSDKDYLAEYLAQIGYCRQASAERGLYQVEARQGGAKSCKQQ